MNQNDILATDGRYTLFITQFIELANEKCYDLNNDNFVYPICKKVNENLTITEEHFNKTFGTCLLKNITKFVELFNIPILPHHKLWHNETESNHPENSESANDIPNFNERTRRRRRNINGIQCSTASYKIKSIIGHKKENNIYLFQVKWVGYSSDDNSCISIDMFNQRIY
ncbi:hypothetical protein BDC45DRAFT_544727 [Circinella umbellata]|nr:hypothetical protein BDC45DRAFT_544727 [Circinella umbellata]